MKSLIIRMFKIEKKTCKKCGIEKMKCLFKFNPKMIDGVENTCKDCHNAYTREYSKKTYGYKTQLKHLGFGKH